MFAISRDARQFIRFLITVLSQSLCVCWKCAGNAPAGRITRINMPLCFHCNGVQRCVSAHQISCMDKMIDERYASMRYVIMQTILEQYAMKRYSSLHWLARPMEK